MKPIFIVLSAFVLLSCNKEDRRIKRYTKNLEGSRLWNGAYAMATQVHDSNGFVGHKYNITVIIDTLISIVVVDNDIIQIGNQELKYNAENNISNTILYNDITSPTRLLYFIEKDSMSYSFYAGKYAELNLYTK